MKKFLVAFTLFAVLMGGLFAEKKEFEQPSSLSYENIPVLKVMEGRDGYVVIYQKNRTGVGSTVVPKSWANGNTENPRKLKFRNLKPGLLKPFMTIVKKDGDFHRVILTLPMNKNDSIWGTARDISEGLDKENMDDVKL